MWRRENGRADDRTTLYHDKTRRYIALANDFTGPILAGRPHVYHHTPFIGLHEPTDWCVLEYIARDRLSGYAGLFRIGSDAGAEYLFRPRGLDAAKRYRTTLDNSGHEIEMSGAELAYGGIPIRLDAVNTSELLLFQAVA